MDEAVEVLEHERGNWPHLRAELARGFAHPRAGAQRWIPRNASTIGIDRLLQTAVAIARLEMPESLDGTRLDPSKVNRLGRDVCRLFELLHRCAGDRLPSTELTTFAETASHIVEPFVAKLLARCDFDLVLKEARKRPSLERWLLLLHEVGRSPFDPELLRTPAGSFERAEGGESWSSLSWCLWQVVGVRHTAAHGAPSFNLSESLSLLWSTAVTVLAIAERSLDLFDIAAGRLPAKFRPIKRLGAGGMGEVFLAVDEVTDSQRAVKVLRVDGETSEQARRSLLQEARALIKLDGSRRVVRFYECTEVANSNDVAVVMAYVEGVSLQQEIDATGPLQVKDAVTTTIEMLSALEEIHSKGIAHQDVKPSNFIRTGTGIVAIDFGLARPIGSQRTRPVEFASDRFVAPEQLDGKADHRSDLYAAGRVLFTLLAGRPPAHDSDPLDLANASVSAELGAVYARATARDPASRFQSADEMRHALERTLAGAPEPSALDGDELAPGRRWGHYRIESEIARMGHWTLVRARQRWPLAARSRLLWVHHQVTDEEWQRLLGPAVALLEGSSPLVQEVEEVLDDPAPALAFQELPSSTSLAAVLKHARRRIGLPAALQLARDVAVGLCAIHAQLHSIVRGGSHRTDVTEDVLARLRVWPPAIRVSSEGAIRLSLFELLRDIRDEQFASNPALLRYRAPELLGGQPTSADVERSHVYTVTLVLWECLVGVQAFGTRDPDELRRKIEMGAVEPLSKHGVTLPDDLDHLMREALSPDPSRRPSTLAGLAARLGSFPIPPHEATRELVDLVASTRAQEGA